MKRNLIAFVLIVMGFFAFYALTAQRGLGWGDSGEFQYRILHGAAGLLSDCESFATAHPLYVALAKGICSTPYQVTLLSCFFGALALGGFFLCSRNVVLTVVLGLAHGLWWLSCVAEVYTMSLTFVAFETFCLLRYLEARRVGWLVTLFLLNGLHLELHNLALLALPVYVVVLIREAKVLGPLRACLPLPAWCLGASFWLQSLAARGAHDVLVGSYGSQTFGLLPENWTIAAFNLALSAMSFFAPVALWRWNRKAGYRIDFRSRWPVVALLAVNFLFFIRYFIISQFTFVLPSVFFAYLLVSDWELKRNRAIPLAVLQVLLPLMACEILLQLPRPTFYASHKYRNDAKYFALPWKFDDDSADRYAAELGGEWNGYPDCGKGVR